MLGVELFGESNWAKIKKRFGSEIGDRGASGYRDKVKSLKKREGSEAVVAAKEAAFQLAIADAKELKESLNL
jgi:hypothetical protein